MISDTQIREVFHFSFLDRLLTISDPSIYVLKGGVNLRFFFNSPRYSEDMDIDVLAGSVETLTKNGYKILEDAAFRRSLRAFGIDDIDINDPSKAKQTQTTQRFRFRFGLITPAGDRLPTKVEFSRRQVDPSANAITEYIDAEVARPYRKLSYRCQHYDGQTAIVQKIKALAGRAVSQARDVFDLSILYRGGHRPSVPLQELLTLAEYDKAIECLEGLTAEDYEGQVVEFLDAASRDQYAGQDAWETLQTFVLETLEANA